MRSELIEPFKARIIPLLPGHLVLFNFADAQRRNCHLGFNKVDEEIEEFNKLLSRSVDHVGHSIKIAGAKWLGFFTTVSTEPIQKLLEDFYQEESILTGWTSLGCRDGITKSARVTVDAKIFRAIRSIYSHLENPNSFEMVVEQLLSNDYSLPVNIPHKLEEVALQPRNPWQCVSRYPAELPMCPFCKGRSFDYLDGDMSIYCGNCLCKDCKAEITFSDVYCDLASSPNGDNF